MANDTTDPAGRPTPAGRGGPVHEGPAHKERRGRGARLLRLIGGALDPRAWAHAVRIVNYYNYAHVQPRRRLTVGPDAAISPQRGVLQRPEHRDRRPHQPRGALAILWAGPGRGRIVIGDDVLFGPEVMVTAATYRHGDGQPVTAQAMDEADVEIGSDVWLGTRAVVLPGGAHRRGLDRGRGRPGAPAPSRPSRSPSAPPRA